MAVDMTESSDNASVSLINKLKDVVSFRRLREFGFYFFNRLRRVIPLNIKDTIDILNIQNLFSGKNFYGSVQRN